jgi:hypothetical protein
VPLAQYGYFLYKEDESDDGKKFFRYCDEIFADIFAIMGYCMTYGVIIGNDKTMTDPFLSFAEENDSDILKIRRKLSYYLNARVMYPKFWFEKACDFLLSEQKIIPPELNIFDHSKLTSTIIMIFGLKLTEFFCEDGINGSVNINQYLQHSGINPSSMYMPF